MKKLIIILTIPFFALSCRESVNPRPYGYFRIDIPQNEYRMLDSVYPYTFEMSRFAVVKQPDKNEPYQIDIFYPKWNATLYCTYDRFKSCRFFEISEESRELAYKHVVRADAITERAFINKEADVYGILYDFRGNSASQVQFFLTDSVGQYLRGSLYFNVLPNPDSIAPVLNFVREDIVRMVETLEWR